MGLERAQLQQHRFRLPGIASDRRGIVLGKSALIALPSFDRLAAFFRLFLAESPLDDLLSLQVFEVRSGVGGRQYVVLFQPSSSELCDRVTRIGQLCGGTVFTGAERHFVKYRDSASPIGYDIAALCTDPADFVLYRETSTQLLNKNSELRFSDFALRLELEADRSDVSTDGAQFFAVRLGLSRNLLGYLERNQIETSAALLQRSSSAFVEDRSQLLVRVERLPPRMNALFARLPGVTRYRAVSENILVEVGFRHPFALDRCATALGQERFYLLSQAGVEVLPQRPQLTPGRDLLFGAAPVRVVPAVTAGASTRLSVAEIALRLRPSTHSDRAKATLIPWSALEALRRYAYLCTPAMLDGHLVGAFAEGLVVVANDGLDLPLGRLFGEAAPGVFVPIGRVLEPRPSPALLVEKVGGTDERLVLFIDDDHVVGLPRSSFAPLGRAFLSRIDPLPALPDEGLGPLEEIGEVQIVNTDLGAFPLWGFRGEQPK